MAMRDGDPRIAAVNREWRRLPLVAAAVAILAMLAMGYDFDNQLSHSEKYGTVTETEAADGVRPSLPPDGGAEAAGASETSSSVP